MQLKDKHEQYTKSDERKHMKQAELTLIIPAYNEEESLKEYLPELIAYCNTYNHKLIIVNDGSKDATGDILFEYDDEALFKPVHHKVNRGYGGALKSGIRACDTTYCITIDADGQHDIQDIEFLLKRMQKEDADMLVGNRDNHQQGLYRTLGKGIIRLIAKLLLPVHIKDLNSGMKIYRTELAKQYLCLCPDSMAFSDTITLAFISQRHLVIEEPINIRPRTSGDSTISTKTAFETIMEIVNMVVLFNPMKIFLPLSMLFILGGIAWAIPFMVMGKGLSTMAALLIISGMIFFLLGLVAEQMGQMRKHLAK